MKKFLAIFLALIMILSISLVACDKTENTDEPAEEDEFVCKKDKDTTDVQDDTDDEGTDTSKGGTPSSAWVEETGTAYIRANEVNVRKQKSTSSNSIGALNLGDSISYTGYNGSWYEVTYEGEKAYVSADFVTTDARIVQFEAPTNPAANSAIHVKSGNKTNLRSDPAAAASTLKGSIDASKTADNGLIILEINKTGSWAKVKFTGKDIEGHEYTDAILYVSTEYISEFASSSIGGGHG